MAAVIVANAQADFAKDWASLATWAHTQPSCMIDGNRIASQERCCTELDKRCAVWPCR